MFFKRPFLYIVSQNCILMYIYDISTNQIYLLMRIERSKTICINRYENWEAVLLYSYDLSLYMNIENIFIYRLRGSGVLAYCCCLYIYILYGSGVLVYYCLYIHILYGSGVLVYSWQHILLFHRLPRSARRLRRVGGRGVSVLDRCTDNSWGRLISRQITAGVC